jgi:glycosyltransferase involved in cell wall biosynthesis
MRDLELAAARCADHVMAITGALRDWLISHDIPEEKISLLPNGCSVDQFQPRTRDEELAGSLGLSDAFVIGYLGSVVFYEGVELMVQAVARARRKSKLNIRLLVVGDGGAYGRVLKEIADTPGDFVVTTGRVPHAEIPRYYSIVDVLALARRPLPVCEAISPLKPFESMAMGKPIITSDVAAIREIVDASDAGLVFRCDDVEDFADQIIRAASSPELYAEMCAKAQAWVTQARDWNVLARCAASEVLERFRPPHAPGESDQPVLAPAL